MLFRSKPTKKKPKKEDLFFRKDDEGRNLFYPWGYPGEAFYIDEKRKRNLKTSIYAGVLLLGVSTLGLMLATEWRVMNMNIYIFSYFWSALLMLVSISYLCGVKLLVQDANPYVQSIEGRKDGTLSVLIFIVTFQMFGIYMTLSDESLSLPVSSTLVSVSAIYTVWISYVLITITRTGSWFTKTTQ